MLEPNVNSAEVCRTCTRSALHSPEEAMKRVDVNFSNKVIFLPVSIETTEEPTVLINISEAIVYVYKTSYRDASVARDRVQLYKGHQTAQPEIRRHLGRKAARRSLLFRSMWILQSPELLLDENTLHNYSFHWEESVMLNGISTTWSASSHKWFLIFYYGSFSSIKGQCHSPERSPISAWTIEQKRQSYPWRRNLSDWIPASKRCHSSSPTNPNLWLTYLSYVRNDVRFQMRLEAQAVLPPTTIPLGDEFVSPMQRFRREISCNLNSRSLSDKVADFTDRKLLGCPQHHRSNRNLSKMLWIN